MVVLGEDRCGKRELLYKYFKIDKCAQTNWNTSPYFFTKEAHTIKGKIIKFSIWTQDYQEQYWGIDKCFYLNSVGALIVYDLTIIETFQKAKQMAHILKEFLGNDIPIVICGNKLELCERNIITKMDEIVNPFCEQEKCLHFYVSGKTGLNVDEAFDTLIREVLKKYDSYFHENRKKRIKLDIFETKNEKKKKKCY